MVGGDPSTNGPIPFPCSVHPPPVSENSLAQCRVLEIATNNKPPSVSCEASPSLWRVATGLEDITGGGVKIGGRVVNDLTPKSHIAMVFQNYALYPHMTVAENIGFALKLRKLPKSEIQGRSGKRRAYAEGAHEADAEQLLMSGEGVTRVDPRATMKPGETARFVVDVERMQLFDADSGATVRG